MDIETTLLVKQEVFVYQIPPRASAKGYRAADWNLGTPIWTGRLKLTARGRECNIRLEDRSTGELFANCPVDSYPGVAVEAVTDSSRYFVLRVVDDNGRTAFIGAGFGDRSDSFDMNVAIQDHFKWVRKDGELTREQAAPPQPALDLGFKDGQTIKINMKIAKKNHKGGCDDDDDEAGEDASPTHQRRPAATSRAGASGLLPPPPSANPVSRVAAGVSAPSAPTTAAPGQSTPDWNDFLSAGGAAAATGADAKTTESPRSGAPTNSSWVQF